MCGIAGKLLYDTQRPVDPGLLRGMAACIAHRGPDDEGVWSDGPIGLASRRLAVLDLSPRGHQPMASADGRLRIAYNGEIYNFEALRDELRREGCTFQSHTDTEVILALYDRHGVDMVRRLRGMFAFALWDAAARRLMLARDRLGKKPLFYVSTAQGVVFGSEPKSLLQDPDVAAAADPAALALYLGLGYVPAPWSAFAGMKKLPPAHVALIEHGRISLSRYWTLAFRPTRRESEEALREELRARVHEAVKLRLVADVPVGALLSGGLDSSVVVAAMRAVHDGPVNTFSIGFDEARYDERAYAARVAGALGTRHRQFVVRPDAAAVLDRLVWHYNEPFADSSALPSMALAQLARREVTVALNGDGGDEAFAGYDRYRAMALASRFDLLPAAVRRGLAAMRGILPAGPPKSRRYRAVRFLSALGLSPVRRYCDWTVVFGRSARDELFSPEFAAATAAAHGESLIGALFEEAATLGVVEQSLWADVHLYLPDDLLVKMDIASMAHSLEVRSPFLDHELMEFAASLPIDLKLRSTTQKYLLRRAFEQSLPGEILSRPKMGFGVPIDRWLRHDLRDLMYDVLTGPTALQRGYFNPAVLRRYLDDHVAGRGHHHHRLWALLVFELWHRTFLDRPCPRQPPGEGLHLDVRETGAPAAAHV